MTKIDVFSGFLGAGKTTLIKKLIDEAYADAKKIISENREKLESLALTLIEKESMDGEDVIKLIKGEDSAA
jgi:ATP-dependent Zn protease